MSYTTLQVPSTQYALPAFPNNAIISLPDDYDANPNKKYPTIIFFHGKGESGKDLNTFLSGYLLRRITQDKWIPQAVNPVTGETEKFIVLAIQDAGGWSPYPTAARIGINYMISKNNLRIDTKRIITTGLSSGGQCSLMYTDWDSSYVGGVQAVVCCSPSAIDQAPKNNLPLMAKTTKAWFLSGDKDGFTDYAKSYDSIIRANGGDSLLTIYSGDHCCWDPIYNGVTTRDYNGKQVNIYEWMLAVTTNVDNATPPPPVDTTPTKSLLYTITTVTKVYSDKTTDSNTTIS